MMILAIYCHYSNMVTEMHNKTNVGCSNMVKSDQIVNWYDWRMQHEHIIVVLLRDTTNEQKCKNPVIIFPDYMDANITTRVCMHESSQLLQLQSICNCYNQFIHHNSWKNQKIMNFADCHTKILEFYYIL
jgi:hypothetical protein